MPDNTVNSDKELVKKLNKSDIEAFNQVFYAYSSKLYRFAFGYLKSKEEAEELVQEVFLKIWEKRAAIKQEYQFRAYLFSIAFNYVKKYFRAKALLNKYLESKVSDTINDKQIKDDVNYSSLKTIVDNLVDSMPEKRRMVFIKSRYEGKSAREISEEMNLTQSTVENHLNHALNYLRQHLKEENLALLLFFWLFIQ